VAEPGGLAVDAPIPPAGILGSEAHDQFANPGGDSGPPGTRVRGGPAAAHELTVPAQDRGWSNQESAAAMSGEQPGEGGDHGAVVPIESRPGRASLQYCQLMAQDEDLDLVGGVGADAQHHPAE
jgi:hypothetical protein